MRTHVVRSVALTLLLSSAALAQRDTTFTWSRSLPAGATFAIRNFSGALDIRAGSTDRVEVRAVVRAEAYGAASDVSFDVRERAPDDVEICTVYRGDNVCDDEHSWNDIRASVHFTVDLPKGLRLRATTGNGDVLIMQTAAEVDASTGNGDVVIRESSSRASASTGNGDVTVAAANGPVRVSTGNGKVVVNTSLGPVNASTGNGDIDVRMISVPATRSQPTMSFTSGNGAIRLTLPKDFNGEIDANTGHGRIDSDFEMRVRGRVEGSRLQATIGNGDGPTIKLRSGHGRLEIRKG